MKIMCITFNDFYICYKQNTKYHSNDSFALNKQKQDLYHKNLKITKGAFLLPRSVKQNLIKHILNLYVLLY